MTRARSQLVSLEDTPYYHCVCRCVRRAFLCGSDGEQCFEHRRGWITQRIKELSSIFAIDIAAYAVMSNHYHIVIYIDAERACNWSDSEVIERWLQLFKGPDIIRRHRLKPLSNEAELKVVRELITKWRQNLHSISWYMRCLNEYIARLANAEDQCTGHFWESRFKSQALLDNTALLTCMAYVDLNPIRANMTDTPEHSDYTSIQERLNIQPETPEIEPLDTGPDKKTRTPENNDENLCELMPFAGSINKNTPSNHLPYNFCDYLELVDWTGRTIREDKRGSIPAYIPPILHRLNIDPEQWLSSCTRVETHFYLAIGPISKLEQFTQHLQQKWLKGINACRQLYKSSALHS